VKGPVDDRDRRNAKTEERVDDHVVGVLESFEVTGPYDMIVRCEAESVDDLGKFIVHAIQKVPGITRTLTCPFVNI
jgi:DNA-binding Lrp family transcriptional regulator